MKRSRRTSSLLLLSMALVRPTSSFSPPPNRRPPRAATPSTSLAASASDTLAPHPLRAFYADLNALYDKTQISIKCPFLRRRVADALDAAAALLQFLVIRHKSLGLSDAFLDGSFGAPGCKPTGRHIKTPEKTLRLPLSDLASRIRSDWEGSASSSSARAGKGYYVTGRLDTTIYRDDCLFTGPDPDMPVRGLRKYLSAAAQLFDSSKSFALLKEISSTQNGGAMQSGLVEVKWELGGVVNLPWHPHVEPWTGWTRYHFDQEGLVYWHEEGWDVEVWRIFMSVVFPKVRWVDVIF